MAKLSRENKNTSSFVMPNCSSLSIMRTGRRSHLQLSGDNKCRQLLVRLMITLGRKNNWRKGIMRPFACSEAFVCIGSSRLEKMLSSSCWVLRSLQEIGGSAAWVSRWVNVHFSPPSVKSRFHICSWPIGHEEADRCPFGNSKRHQRRMMDRVLLLLPVFYRWNDIKNLMAG